MQLAPGGRSGLCVIVHGKTPPAHSGCKGRALQAHSFTAFPPSFHRWVWALAPAQGDASGGDEWGALSPEGFGTSGSQLLIAPEIGPVGETLASTVTSGEGGM